MRRIDWVLNGSLQRGHAGPFALALIVSRHPLQKLWPRSSSVDQNGHERVFFKCCSPQGMEYGRSVGP